MKMEIVIVPDLRCPRCGALEIENPKAPVKEWKWQIRPNKVQDHHGKWWSQCLICEEAGDKDKGWFSMSADTSGTAHRLRGLLRDPSGMIIPWFARIEPGGQPN